MYIGVIFVFKQTNQITNIIAEAYLANHLRYRHGKPTLHLR